MTTTKKTKSGGAKPEAADAQQTIQSIEPAIKQLATLGAAVQALDLARVHAGPSNRNYSEARRLLLDEIVEAASDMVSNA